MQAGWQQLQLSFLCGSCALQIPGQNWQPLQDITPSEFYMADDGNVTVLHNICHMLQIYLQSNATSAAQPNG